jgi:hypothetical protein
VVVFTSRHAAACALFAEATRRFGRHQLKATGRSMLPAIWPGDLITVAHVPCTAIRAGDVIAVRRGASIVVHRLVRWLDLPAGPHAVTRGDWLRADDDPVPAASIIGRVIEVSGDPRLRSGALGHASALAFETAWIARRFASAALRGTLLRAVLSRGGALSGRWLPTA